MAGGELPASPPRPDALAVDDDDAVAVGERAVGEAHKGRRLAGAGGAGDEDVLAELLDVEVERPVVFLVDAQPDLPGWVFDTGCGGVGGRPGWIPSRLQRLLARHRGLIAPCVQTDWRATSEHRCNVQQHEQRRTEQRLGRDTPTEHAVVERTRPGRNGRGEHEAQWPGEDEPRAQHRATKDSEHCEKQLRTTGGRVSRQDVWRTSAPRTAPGNVTAPAMAMA